MGRAVTHNPSRLTIDALAAMSSEGIRMRCGVCLGACGVGTQLRWCRLHCRTCGSAGQEASLPPRMRRRGTPDRTDRGTLPRDAQNCPYESLPRGDVVIPHRGTGSRPGQLPRATDVLRCEAIRRVLPVEREQRSARTNAGSQPLLDHLDQAVQTLVFRIVVQRGKAPVNRRSGLLDDSPLETTCEGRKGRPTRSAAGQTAFRRTY